MLLGFGGVDKVLNAMIKAKRSRRFGCVNNFFGATPRGCAKF